MNTRRSDGATPDGSVTYKFHSGDKPLPALRPLVPLMYQGKPFAVLRPELGQVRVLGYGESKINNCSTCPAIGGPAGPRCAHPRECAAKQRLAKGRDKSAKPAKPAPKAKEICSFGRVATAMEMAMATAEANALQPPKQVCRQFMQKFPKGCRFGDNCRGLHYQPK